MNKKDRMNTNNMKMSVKLTKPDKTVTVTSVSRNPEVVLTMRVGMMMMI